MRTPRRRVVVAAVLVATLVASCTGSGTSTSKSKPKSTSTSAAGHAAGGSAAKADPRVFAYDRTAPLDAETTPFETGSDYTAERVTYRSGSEFVPGLLSFPTKGNDPVPCVIVQTGYGGSKEDVRSLWPYMATFGMGTFSIDARLHGERGTAEQRAAASASPRKVRDYMVGTVVDLRRAIDFLSTETRCDPRRIGYLGMSMGAWIGAMLAGVDQRVHATELLSGGADWRTLFTKTRDLGKPGGVELVNDREDPAKLDADVRILAPIDPKLWVSRISPRPVMMMNGRSDPIVPPASAQELHTAAKRPKDVIWYDGGHMATGLAFGVSVAQVFGWFWANLIVH